MLFNALANILDRNFGWIGMRVVFACGLSEWLFERAMISEARSKQQLARPSHGKDKGIPVFFETSVPWPVTPEIAF